MKITACLIVKNEEKMLEAALQSVRDFDEIVVVDTGSTDNTVEIAKKFTDKVHFFEWCDDFASARNFALSKASGDWVLSIDADEVLLEGGTEKIRSLISNTNKNTFKIRLVSKGQSNYSPRLFKSDGNIKWVGRAHETLNFIEDDNRADVTIEYGYSPAHDTDPDRMLRILSLAVSEHPTSGRDLYYLAREYYYRKDYEKAIETFKECVKHSTWNPEIADAFLYLARCCFYSGKGGEAREYGFRAVQVNPDFKEALRFLSLIHYSPWKEKWAQFAELASNRDVLFVRSDSTVSSKIPKKLHHIWVGPKEAPTEWMDTWKEKHPEWEYTLWDNDKVFSRKWRNQKHVDYYREKGIWHGVADVIRYEILFEEGGFMPGADSICLNPIDELLEDGFEAYGVYENEKVRPGLVSPLYACAPGNNFAEKLIEGLLEKQSVGEPWIDTGNTYMMKMIEKHVPAMKIFPSYVFNPVHYSGETYTGNAKIYGKQMWGTTTNAYKDRPEKV